MTAVHIPNTIITKEERKQVEALVSQEGGLLIHSCRIIWLGNCIPLMFIFPRKYFEEYFIRDGSSGCIGTTNYSGWIKEEDFKIFIKHFTNYAKPSNSNLVLVSPDNYGSHSYLPVKMIVKKMVSSC